MQAVQGPKCQDHARHCASTALHAISLYRQLLTVRSKKSGSGLKSASKMAMYSQSCQEFHALQQRHRCTSDGSTKAYAMRLCCLLANLTCGIPSSKADSCCESAFGRVLESAHLVEGAGLVAGAVGAAADLDLDAAFPPLHHLVVHQVPRALVRAVIQHLFDVWVPKYSNGQSRSMGG